MAAAAPSVTEWHAALGLGFERRGPRTVLAARRHRGPLAVQRPFYPEGAPCHVYLLHPPGGIVGGDQLCIDAHVGPDAHALLTTPASGKFYRSRDRLATQHNRLTLAAGATLEWLPQDTILFDGCRAQTSTRVEMETGARFIGWEILTLGRPAAGERFETGSSMQDLELWREGAPVMIERTRLEGGAQVLEAPWGLQGKPVMGTFIASPVGDNVWAEVSAIINAPDSSRPAGNHGVRMGVSRVDGTLVCRALGHSAVHVREQFQRLWGILRRAVLERAACPPRVWST